MDYRWVFLGVTIPPQETEIAKHQKLVNRVSQEHKEIDKQGSSSLLTTSPHLHTSRITLYFHLCKNSIFPLKLSDLMNQSLTISSCTPFLSARKRSPPVGGKVISRNDKGAANDSFPSLPIPSFPRELDTTSSHLPSSFSSWLIEIPLRDYLYPSVPN